MATTFTRLVRFLAKNGRTHYGDAIVTRAVTDFSKAKQAQIIHGNVLGKHKLHIMTDRVADSRQLLSPLACEDVGTVRCMGLNYENHARESNLPVPQCPVVFYKPKTSLSGPTDPIPVHAMAQEGPSLDYKCELVAVIGKKCFDVAESEALNFVLGYAVGDDVSHRDWQIKRGGGQWSLGKGFDGWAPYGPGIVSSNAIKDPQNLRIATRVNGKTMQDDSTAGMIFSVKNTIAFLSRGTTLLPEDIIFTGTPSGVAMGRDPQPWLEDRDVVEVELERVGTCQNAIEFDRYKRANL